jgi:PD-(D/E)XK endonuclease
MRRLSASGHSDVRGAGSRDDGGPICPLYRLPVAEKVDPGPSGRPHPSATMAADRRRDSDSRRQVSPAVGQVSVRGRWEHMFVRNSNAKGAIAEEAIVLAAMKLRIPVLRPVAEHSRTDLVLDIGGELWRVQVKWGRLGANGDVVIAVLHTSRCTPRGHVRCTYSAREIDLFAVYCGELDRSFLLPASRFAGRNCISLRLTPSRNGQHACINLADDFDFDGAVAQLARAPDRQSGGQGFESPQLHSFSSTTESAPIKVGSEPFRDRLGYWMERVAQGEEILVTFRGRPRIHVVPAVGEMTVPALRSGLEARPP